MLMSKATETNLSQVACSSFITSLIHFFDLKNYTKVDCAFHYWAEQNSKVLSQTAWIVFAVAMTQVSVERLFRGVKFIVSGLHNSLAEDTLQATVLQRTNVGAYQFSVRIQHSPVEFFSVLLKLFLYNVPLQRGLAPFRLLSEVLA